MSKGDSSPELDTTCIGFIGLGAMGSPTVEHMLDLGYTVAVYDIKQEKVKNMQHKGAIGTYSVKELASKSTCIFTMIPGPKELHAVYLGDEGIINNLKHKGTYMFECSTVGFHAIEKVVKASAEAEQVFMDCPISGGIQGAKNHTLTFMVGASPKIFESAKPFLHTIGKTIIHCGPTGSAQAVKICNNLCFIINMMGAIEGYKLASKLGLDLQNFTDVVNTSTGSSFATKVYNPCPNVVPNCPANNNYEGGYSLNLALKDLHIAQDTAKEYGINLETLNCVEKLYKKALNEGLGDLDFSAYYKNYESN